MGLSLLLNLHNGVQFKIQLKSHQKGVLGLQFLRLVFAKNHVFDIGMTLNRMNNLDVDLKS